MCVLVSQRQLTKRSSHSRRPSRGQHEVLGDGRLQRKAHRLSVSSVLVAWRQQYCGHRRCREVAHCECVRDGALSHPPETRVVSSPIESEAAFVGSARAQHCDVHRAHKGVGAVSKAIVISLSCLQISTVRTHIRKPNP